MPSVVAILVVAALATSPSWFPRVTTLEVSPSWHTVESSANLTFAASLESVEVKRILYLYDGPPDDGAVVSLS